LTALASAIYEIWMPPPQKSESRDVATPLSGTVVVRRLGLATINLYIKYEISTFTHYQDMKGDENCKNLGVRVPRLSV